LTDTTASIEQQKLDLERQKQADDLLLARERLAIETRQARGFSGAQVTIITLVVSGLFSLLTGLVGGLFNVQTTATSNQGQLDVKRTEVEGQLAVQTMIAEAERDRMAAQQSFDIVVQATKGLPQETAAANLLFFVKAGILQDPDGKILALAETGEAPDLPQASGGTENPILSRLEAASTPTDIGSSEAALRVEQGLIFGTPAIPVSHVVSPNLSERNDPRYIVVDYTAGTAKAAISVWSRPEVRGSAHLLIARDGSVTQFVPFDYGAWHAGRSQWGSVSGLNRHSIGIALENWGKLTSSGDGWTTYAGGPVPESEVAVLRHKSESTDAGWQTYTDAQLAALEAVVAAIRGSIPQIVDMIGQDDISPDRKLGPGPAFPMEDVREATFDRRLALDPPE
jgi:N-acetylmuramoyl-L-alanine amidase